MDLQALQKLLQPNQTKIVLLVMDGLGGLPRQAGGQTALESAYTPQLDRLAAEGICGLQQPVAAGITPGSGPAHLGLFGYDPLTYQVGRGVLAALGIGFELTSQDVAARGNFCTLDADGRVTDRRAGRISSAQGEALCERLRQIELPDVEVFIEPVKEYRFALVLRGAGLSGELSDSDPQQTGVPPQPIEPRSPKARRTAELVQAFVHQARAILAAQQPANMVLLRGFAQRPDWPTMEQVFGVRAGAIAAYPMYRGLAKLVGMHVLETGEDLEEEFATLERHWNEFDFFYLHIKPIDSAGEDGDFERKVRAIEAVDRLIPRLRELQPDVIVVTGDHSTPAVLQAHSWHPVPTLLWSAYCRSDAVEQFGERACMCGGLGPRFPAVDLLPLALANALRLQKFGA
jgi:2,3-bisphosphoglycerate-independent phosphoglycerate mutase